MKALAADQLGDEVVTQRVKRALLEARLRLEAHTRVAGHSKLDMTQRYAHATADDLRAAIDKLAK